jgi:hypothetical protein
MKAPFPWFGGKRRVAHVVWSRFGDVATYNEPFAGSLAVLLERPHPPNIETVNDIDCVSPETRILKSDLTWWNAGAIKVGDTLIGFDEQNGPARSGLRAPTRYRRLQVATVTGTRRLRKPCYRLVFQDGTVVTASEDHLWLAGSHRTGGRGWRWVKTKSLVCNRKTQRSWVLKVADVGGAENTWGAGWIGGMFDGEGCIAVGPGVRITLAQKEGPLLVKMERMLLDRGYHFTRVKQRNCSALQINGGIRSSLSFLMRFRPGRLISNLSKRLGEISLYGRKHNAVGLLKKEFVGVQEVVAIQTSTRTFIAEGFASHNCFIANFWRALSRDPDKVAYYADWPVNEADLHARHKWLVSRWKHTAKRIMANPDFYDARVAGWWVWGQCLWIGSGWCQKPEWTGRVNGGRAARGILTEQYGKAGCGHNQHRRPALSRDNGLVSVGENPSEQSKRPKMRQRGEDGVPAYSALYGEGNQRRWQGGGQGGGSGVHAPCFWKQTPDLSGDAGAAGRGIHGSGFEDKTGGIYVYMRELAARLRRVRVCCGDFERVLTPSVTTYIGTTAVFLDPPYDPDLRKRCYSRDCDGEQKLSVRAREWALKHGNDLKMRIALCGYESEHKEHMPADWECVAWKAHGGYSRSEQGRANRERERIWFSPHCLKETQPGLL